MEKAIVKFIQRLVQFYQKASWVESYNLVQKPFLLSLI